MHRNYSASNSDDQVDVGSKERSRKRIEKEIERF
jgi:hypothetical protein